MSKHQCPQCLYCKSWSIRRNARKCQKCRKEWVPPRWLVVGIKVSTRDWRLFLKCFLRYKTQAGIKMHFKYSHPTLLKMSRSVRLAMSEDLPVKFSGVVEVDETYIAGTWYNKRWHIRQHGTKRGRGTTKQPVFGIFERRRKIVRAWLVDNVQKRTLMPIIKQRVRIGSMIYSDGYQLYEKTVQEGYKHESVDHHQNEYARGEINTNSMEGFWGLLKRRLRNTGGVRRDRLFLYVNEEVWRYNHLALSEEEKIQKLLHLLKQFGGKKFS